jgi:hypothetical protein
MAAAPCSQGLNTTDDAPSTPKSSQHFGERQTMEKTNNLFSDSTEQRSTQRLVIFHGNQLVLRFSMATVCFELGDSFPRSASLSFAVGFGAWGCC